MVSKWMDLVDMFNIDENAPSQEAVDALAQWCHQEVSQEKKFTGDVHEAYSEIRNFLTDYFVNIASLSPEHLCEVQSHLNNMNGIQYAASKGYDRWLAQQFHTDARLTAIIDMQTPAGMTALHFATLYGHESIVQLLLKHKANTRLTSNLGYTALHTALMEPSEPLTEKCKKIRCYELVLQQDPGLIDVLDKARNSVAHFMAQYDFPEQLKRIVRAGKTGLLNINNDRLTPLHQAVLNNHPNCVKYLATLPVCRTARDRNGKLPSFYAAAAGNLTLFKLCRTPDLTEMDDHGQHVDQVATGAVKDYLQSSTMGA